MIQKKQPVPQKKSNTNHFCHMQHPTAQQLIEHSSFQCLIYSHNYVAMEKEKNTPKNKTEKNTNFSVGYKLV